jgi:GNAT superfamily N-acetyltransferase
VIVSPFTEAARAFVRETTSRVRWPRDEWGVPRLPWGDWSYAYGSLVDLWLRTGSCAVVDAGDDVFLGFALAHGGLVRMVYVKREFRGAGLGRQLLAAVGTIEPHCPNESWRAWARGWQTKAA